MTKKTKYLSRSEAAELLEVHPQGVSSYASLECSGLSTTESMIYPHIPEE